MTAALCGRCYDFVDDAVAAPCAEKPEALAGKPIGQYHCPDCGAMVVAGVPHPPVCVPCSQRRHPGLDGGPLELGGHGSAKWVDGPPALRCAQCGSPFVNGYVRTMELEPVDVMGSTVSIEHAGPRAFDVCSEACAERLRAELG